MANLPAVRKTDMTMGHGCYPPQKILQGSQNVFIQGVPAHRQGDAVQPHTCKDAHPTFGGSGSPTVYVNGKALQRVSDSASCGSIYLSGARTVFAG